MIPETSIIHIRKFLSPAPSAASAALPALADFFFAGTSSSAVVSSASSPSCATARGAVAHWKENTTRQIINPHSTVCRGVFIIRDPRDEQCSGKLPPARADKRAQRRRPPASVKQAAGYVGTTTRQGRRFSANRARRIRTRPTDDRIRSADSWQYPAARGLIRDRAARVSHFV